MLFKQTIQFPLCFPQMTPKHTIVPFFMPFAGCPHRCLYCAQTVQTGTAQTGLVQRLDNLRASLLQRSKANTRSCAHPNQHATNSVELAFYGGTFTTLPEQVRQYGLDIAHEALAHKAVAAVRCSTRPDATAPHQLLPLVKAGFSLVELGVQSFDDNALRATKRGYTTRHAFEGCQAILSAGLHLGIQLLPGMPGVSPECFLQDVDTALTLRPTCLRFYPCLVLDHTPLAKMWQQGHYTPWDVATTISTLGTALLRTWTAGVPVIRMGLAPEKDLQSAILAGPAHPELGNLVRGEALFQLVSQQVHRLQASTPWIPETPPALLLALTLPAPCQGFVFGHKGDMRNRWASLGIDLSHTRWHSEPYGELRAIIP